MKPEKTMHDQVVVSKLNDILPRYMRSNQSDITTEAELGKAVGDSANLIPKVRRGDRRLTLGNADSIGKQLRLPGPEHDDLLNKTVAYVGKKTSNLKSEKKLTRLNTDIGSYLVGHILQSLQSCEQTIDNVTKLEVERPVTEDRTDYNMSQFVRGATLVYQPTGKLKFHLENTRCLDLDWKISL